MATVKHTLGAIRALPNMTAHHVDGEYRVAKKHAYYHGLGMTHDEADARQEAQAYYTNDSDDALATARLMAAETNA